MSVTRSKGPVPTIRSIRLSVLLVIPVLALAGCGDDDSAAADRSEAPARPAGTTTATTATATTTTTTEAAASSAETSRAAAPRGTTITLRDSRFGSMLFNARRQAIYIFQNDPRGRSVCYGGCARAWPPVYTRGRPRARDGVRSSLLGTTRRRDGRRQVTYAGKPLYYYVNEDPGQVLCHNVRLNGGLWWVVGPDGRRRD